MQGLPKQFSDIATLLRYISFPPHMGQQRLLFLWISLISLAHFRHKPISHCLQRKLLISSSVPHESHNLSTYQPLLVSLRLETSQLTCLLLTMLLTKTAVLALSLATSSLERYPGLVRPFPNFHAC